MIFANIVRWAHDRDLAGEDRAHAQMVKLAEEVGEVAAAVARKDIDKLKDGIGDTVVVLTILAAQHGLSIESCIEHAWKQIRDRRGKTVNGIFVKDGDSQ